MGRRALLALCLASSGCAEVAQANVRSAEVLLRDGSSDTARGVAIGVLATTGVAGLVLLGFALDGSSPDASATVIPPPKPAASDHVEHGWSLARAGGRATFYACSAPHHCSFERRTIDEADLLDAEPVGFTFPIRPDTTSAPETAVLELRLRRPSTPVTPQR